MTTTALPRTEPDTDVEELIAATLPYLRTAWGDEAAEHLRAMGVPDDEVRRLVAAAALEAS